MSNLDLTEMRELADAAGQLLRFGLSPRLRPNRDRAYNALVLRYQADLTFQSVVRAMATGQSLTVLVCDRMEGLVLAPTEDSPYRIRLADYVLLDSATIGAAARLHRWDNHGHQRTGKGTAQAAGGQVA